LENHSERSNFDSIIEVTISSIEETGVVVWNAKADNENGKNIEETLIAI
jgi:hypothetical protein